MQLFNSTSSARLAGICFWLIAGTFVHDCFGQFHPNNLQGRIRIPFKGNQTIQSRPLEDLPENLDFETGKVSLVADFDNSGQNRVSVYLVNPTSDTYQLETVAMEIPIVLEAYLGNGHWERAESHNAYGFLSTRKMEFVSATKFRVKKARYWMEGESAKLRYALYQNGRAALVSEPFDGKLPIGEIDKARHDLMAASIVPEPLRIRYLPEETTLEEIKSEWYDKLTLLRSFGPCYIDLDEAQKWAAFIHENPVASREERDMAIRLQKELLQPWPPRYDISRLHDRCRSILNEKESTNAGLRPLCWKILKANSEENSVLKDPGLARIAWNTIQGKSALPELEAATEFLCVNYIAENHSPIREYKDHQKLLGHENPYVRITAANLMLSRKGDNQEVVLDYYLKNHTKMGAYELVRILHFDRLYNPYSNPKWDLWGKALDKDMEFCVPQLSLMFESDNTPTKLRKFSQSSVLPNSIKQRLEKFRDQSPVGPRKQAIERLLDDVSTKQNRFFQRAFL